MSSAYHPAKIGDIIYSLPAVHRRGGVDTYFIKRPEVAKYKSNVEIRSSESWEDCENIATEIFESLDLTI